MAKRGANVDIVGNGAVQSAAELDHVLGLLGDAHDERTHANSLHADTIDSLGELVSSLNAARQSLIQKRIQARHEADQGITDSADYITAMLNDPNSAIHPVMRAVLLAPSTGTGSLKNPNTFRASSRLGQDLAQFSDVLEGQDESRPAVLLSSVFDYGNQTRQWQLNFGQTTPHMGLTPHEGQRIVSSHSSGVIEYGPQPVLALPVQGDAINAVSPSAYNSHYVYNNSMVIEVDGFGRGSTAELSPRDYVPQTDELDLPLPVGNLDVPSTAKPLAYYDLPDGGLEVIEMPNVIGESTKVVVAIGETAVLQLLADFNNGFTKASPEQRRVIRNMTLRVANQDLRLAVKRRDF
jgi:hypothetical protein